MLTQRLKRLPLLGPLAHESYHLAAKICHWASDCEALQSLSACGAPAAGVIAQGLRQLSRPLPSDEEAALARIEAERANLLRDHNDLIDGRLGAGGTFDEGRTVRQACQASKPPKAARCLYHLVRALDPKTVIELGTNVGVSSAYQVMALQRNGPHGRLMTLEMSPYRLQVAQGMHRSLGLTNVFYAQGKFADTLDKVLADLPLIDMAFIDGHHDYEPTLQYFRQIRTHTGDGALFVFDDIRWNPGMQAAWKVIQDDPRVELAVDLHSMGLCIVRQEPPAACYRVPKIRGLLY